MNKFMIFACLAVIGCSNWAAARPDVSLGYRYHAGQSSSGGGLLTAPVLSTGTSYQPTASGTTYFSSSPSIGQLSGGGSSSGGISYASNGDSGISYGTNGGSASSISSIGSIGSIGFGSGSDSIGLSGLQSGPSINYNEQEAYLSHLQNFQPAEVSKTFYFHTAPVDHDEQQIVRYVNVGRPRKNYRVVFINAPSSSASKAKIIANVAPVEEKTAIYVLAKKSNALDVSAEVVTPAPVNNKPEVFFIKYKTPQEAVHAQHTIQAQYDSLGGSTQVSDEGIVPVSSVIGSLGDGGASGVVADGTVIGTGGVPDTAYVADGSSGIGQVGVNVVHTGTNTQATYLPAAHK